jgi:hypothetical protein
MRLFRHFKQAQDFRRPPPAARAGSVGGRIA